MRWFFYTYATILGVFKFALYKLAFGKDLATHGIPHLNSSCKIRIRKGGRLEIGSNVVLGAGTFLSVTSGASVKIGNDTVLGFNNVITCRDSLTIGNNVSFGPGVTIFDHDHIYGIGKSYAEAGYVQAPINIGDNVWLGSNVIILKGVSIGAGSVVAAGSIVTKDIPNNTLFYNKREDIKREILQIDK